MQTVLIFYGQDGEAAEAAATAERAKRNRAMVRHAEAFTGEIERCDRVVILDDVSDWDARRLGAAYAGQTIERAIGSEADAHIGTLPPADSAQKTWVPIPDDWRSMKYFAMRALASDIAGKAVSGKDDVIAVIEAELARR